jgi:hypothetical protein
VCLLKLGVDRILVKGGENSCFEACSTQVCEDTYTGSGVINYPTRILNRGASLDWWVDGVNVVKTGKEEIAASKHSEKKVPERSGR